MLEAIADFGVADAIDVGLAAALLYAALSWLRRSRAILVAVGVAVAGTAYALASGLGLSLTPSILGGFFAGSAVALVVIFQEELRQAFEELAAWVLGRRADFRPRLDSTQILVESLMSLAREKIGALVVIPGVQRLDRLLHGGHRLGGHVSQALLDSLFDPHSDGHDGAAIIEDGQLMRFGVQLPLSKNLQQLAGRGTRHSAALGLSERSDALCLVVSEERGTVSAARDGMLGVIQSPDELRTAIDQFYRDRRALAAPRPRLVEWLRRRPAERAAALALAMGLWAIFVAGGRPAEEVLSVAVRVQHVPAGLAVAAIEPPELRITAAGQSRRLAFVGAADFAVAIDATEAGPGQTRYAPSAVDVRAPDGVAVMRVHGAAVTVRFAPAPETALAGEEPPATPTAETR
jgi:uncharacterized protein (TIGR00159 family)